MYSLKALNQRDFLVQYKTSIPGVTDVNVINENAWVHTSINMGMQMEISPFDKKKLTDAIPQIRDMTVQEPKIFYPQLKELLVSEKNRNDLEAGELIQRLEREANTFSQNILIPEMDYKEFIEQNPKGFTEEVIQCFAEKINILPGIVVGRLQQDHLLSYRTALNNMKIRYMMV